MVCLVVKHHYVEVLRLSKYLEKVSNYPIHLSNCNDKRFLLMTKDNILKQLFRKSKKVFKEFGLPDGEEEKEK